MAGLGLGTPCRGGGGVCAVPSLHTGTEELGVPGGLQMGFRFWGGAGGDKEGWEGREHQLAGCVGVPCFLGTPVEKLPQEWGWGLGVLLESPPPSPPDHAPQNGGHPSLRMAASP